MAAKISEPVRPFGATASASASSIVDAISQAATGPPESPSPLEGPSTLLSPSLSHPNADSGIHRSSTARTGYRVLMCDKLPCSSLGEKRWQGANNVGTGEPQLRQIQGIDGQPQPPWRATSRSRTD